jgi:integrase
VFDDNLPGFGLRLRRAGSRTWIYQFKIGAQQRRVTLGSVAALSAAQARRTASELHAAVRLGRDPAGEKDEARARASETMAIALRSYLAEKRQSVKPSSYVGVERHLRKHCRRLHGLQLAKIDRRAIAATLTAVDTNSGPIEANRVRASLSAFFAWCMSQGLLNSNPVIGTNRRPERSRDRVLADAELRAIWTATARTDDYSAVVRLLMLTGCRANEIAALSWSEVRDDTIIIPGDRTKNGRTHMVPVCEPAKGILRARPRREGRDLIFGRRPDRPLSGWTVLKTALDERIRESGAIVAPWTHHDLRRTVATKMADELAIAPHIVEAILNHVSGHKHGVAGVYNRAGYEIQKRQALALWGVHLLAITEGQEAAENAVPPCGV